MTIKNVSIGDKFKKGKTQICEVVDFHFVKSFNTGETIRIECIAKQINTELCNNSFEVAFATVVRGRINEYIDLRK